MNSVLEQIVTTGYTTTPGGTKIDVRYSAIPPKEGRFLQQLIMQSEPMHTLEIGLAYGISALYICEALERWPDARHIVIDPNQFGGEWGQSWEGTGIHNLRNAGYESKVELLEMPSYQALSQLEQKDQKIDFAFVDGWHTFDYTLVDFFFIDKMLKVGGIVAFDDANWTSIRKLCRYIATNFSSYSVVQDHDEVDEQESLRRRILEKLLTVQMFSTQKQNIFTQETIIPDRSLGLRGRCIAFRKNDEDARRWDHHARF